MIYNGPTNFNNDAPPALNAQHMNLIVAALQQNGYDIEALRNSVGSPLTADTAADMTDTSKIYVYTGSETGYTKGNWYYYDIGQRAWVSGGAYNAVAVDTDKSLTILGAAADAKTTGDWLRADDERFDGIDDDISNLDDKVAVLRDSLATSNAYNYLDDYKAIDGTNKGITWEALDGIKTRVSGTSTEDNVFQNFYSSGVTGSIPDWFIPGKTYHAEYSSENVEFWIGVSRTSASGTTWILVTKTSSDFTVPSDCNGVMLRFSVRTSGTTVDEIVEPKIMSAPSNQELVAAMERMSIETKDGLIAISGMNPEPNVSWVVGAINITTGVNSNSTNRLRSDYLDISGVPTVSTDDITSIVLFFYSDSAYLGYSDLLSGFASIKDNAKSKGYTTATRVRFVARYTDNRVIEDESDLKARIHINMSTEAAIEAIVPKYLTSQPVHWSIGGLYATTGKLRITSDRCIDLSFFSVKNMHHVITDDTVSVSLYFYSEKNDDTFVGASAVFSGSVDVAAQASLIGNANYVRVLAKYNDGRAITDIEDIAARIRLVEYVLPDFTELDGMDYSHTSGSGPVFSFKKTAIRWQDGVESASTNNCSSEMIPIDGFYRIFASGDVLISTRCYAGGVYLGTSMPNWNNAALRYDILNTYPTADAVRICAIYNSRADITDLTDISSKVRAEALQPIQTIRPELERGSYSTPSPRYIESTTVIRHKHPIPVGHSVLIKWPDSYYMSYRRLGEDYRYMGYPPNWLTTSFFTLNTNDSPGVGYLLILFRRADGAEMTDDDLAALQAGLRIVVVGAEEEHKPRFALSTPVLMQSIDDTEAKAPTMCAVKYKREQGKNPVPIGWLFRDNEEPYNIYWSTDGQTLTKLFQWNKAVTDNGNRTPIEYSMMISDEGDIVCAYRGELAYVLGTSVIRQNPIVYPHNDYEHPVMVDFGADDPPINGVLDTGYYAESGRIFIAEYTRYRHTYAYVWRVTAPYTNKSNWEKIRTFEVSGNVHGFKHCHYIDRDIYTGILWMSTGDIPPSAGESYVGTPGIYYSTDNGTTWNTLIEGSEKYCRQLGFVWEKDYVYWATDSGNPDNHFLMRAKRDSNGIIDINSAEDIWKWYTGQATYSLCYSDTPHGILFLDHIDSDSLNPLNVYFWDLDKEKMLYLGRIDPVGRGFLGFRVEAVNHYPAPGNFGYLCGFGLNQSFIKMPGMKYLANHDTSSNGYTYNDEDNVGCLNNILIRIIE